jgi:hypothetical protein
MSRPVTLVAAAVLFACTAGAALADRPGADWMKPGELTQKLEAAGYSNITGLEADDGYWEGKAVKNGKIVEFKADPRTGAIVKEEIDD